jgi:GMP synthase (glutamine-hydrolysing)
MNSESDSLPIIIAIQNGAAGPINLVGKWLTESGFEIRTIHAYNGQPLPRSLLDLEKEIAPRKIAGLIPLGGSIGAYDDEKAKWLPGEKELIRNCVKEGFPVLGICLGAQLLAASLDGEVGKSKEPEIGLHHLTITDSTDLIFGALGSNKEVMAIQWHQDMVTKLPSCSTSIASSELCANQIYRVADLHYGVQFHPEADPTIVGMWEKKRDEAYQRSEQRTGISAEIAGKQANLEEIWKPAIKRWGEMAQRQLSTRLAPQ